MAILYPKSLANLVVKVGTSHQSLFQPFHGLWFIQAWICRKIADQIELKFGVWTHYGTPQAWSTSGCSLLNSCNFLASDWSGSFHAFAHKPADRFELKFDGQSPGLFNRF